MIDWLMVILGIVAGAAGAVGAFYAAGMLAPRTLWFVMGLPVGGIVVSAVVFLIIAHIARWI